MIPALRRNSHPSATHATHTPHALRAYPWDFHHLTYHISEASKNFRHTLTFFSQLLINHTRDTCFPYLPDMGYILYLLTVFVVTNDTNFKRTFFTTKLNFGDAADEGKPKLNTHSSAQPSNIYCWKTP